MDAADLLLTEVRELVRARGIDPLKDASDLDQLVTQAEEDYLRRSDAGLVPPLIDPKGARTHVLDSMAGLGPLQGYLDDESIEEIWVNAPGRVFVARSGRPELTTTILESEDLTVLVERMLRASGRRLDLSSPFVDAQLAGGQRLHVVIPPITSQHWAVNIRKHTSRASRTADLVRMGSLTSQVAAFLDASVQAGLNILVSGATQAGKTTMVRALAGAIPGAQRVISCEEVFELALRNRDCVAMQTRPPNLEGVGEISLRRLVKEALRMRPDRLLIGEVREAEALDLLIAMNSGLPGRRSNLPSAFLVLPHTAQRIAAYPHRTTHAAGWSHRCAEDGQGHGRARPHEEDGLDVVGECRRAGAGAGGPLWERGCSGRVRPAGAARNHPHRCRPTPRPRRSPPGTRAPGSKDPRATASPFNGGHRAHPRIALGTASATPRGEPAASPPHRALPPGHSRLIPCSTSALPSCMGEDLSPTQDLRQGRFQAISDTCGTTHQHRVFPMIPGIHCFPTVSESD